MYHWHPYADMTCMAQGDWPPERCYSLDEEGKARRIEETTKKNTYQESLQLQGTQHKRYKSVRMQALIKLSELISNYCCMAAGHIVAIRAAIIVISHWQVSRGPFLLKCRKLNSTTLSDEWWLPGRWSAPARCVCMQLTFGKSSSNSNWPQCGLAAPLVIRLLLETHWQHLI